MGEEGARIPGQNLHSGFAVPYKCHAGYGDMQWVSPRCEFVVGVTALSLLFCSK